jgi:hypothetical protein
MIYTVNPRVILEISWVAEKLFLIGFNSDNDNYQRNYWLKLYVVDYDTLSLQENII